MTFSVQRGWAGPTKHTHTHSWAGEEGITQLELLILVRWKVDRVRRGGGGGRGGVCRCWLFTENCSVILAADGGRRETSEIRGLCCEEEEAK